MLAEDERNDMRELLTFLAVQPEAEAFGIVQNIRANGYEPLLELIRHAREEGHEVSAQELVSPPSATMMSGQQRLPSINTMLVENAQAHERAEAQAQMQMQALASSSRNRIPSVASDVSSGSMSSPVSAT